MIDVSDLVARFGSDEITHLSDKDGLHALNVAVVKTAIVDAVADIASYLNGIGGMHWAGGQWHFAGDLPPVLKAKACDLARFYLSDDNATEIVKMRYVEAINWLKLAQSCPQMLHSPALNSPSIAVMGNSRPSLWQSAGDERQKPYEQQ